MFHRHRLLDRMRIVLMRLTLTVGLDHLRCLLLTVLLLWLSRTWLWLHRSLIHRRSLRPSTLTLSIARTMTVPMARAMGHHLRSISPRSRSRTHRNRHISRYTHPTHSWSHSHTHAHLRVHHGRNDHRSSHRAHHRRWDRSGSNDGVCVGTMLAADTSVPD